VGASIYSYSRAIPKALFTKEEMKRHAYSWDEMTSQFCVYFHFSEEYSHIVEALKAVKRVLFPTKNPLVKKLIIKVVELYSYF